MTELYGKILDSCHFEFDERWADILPELLPDTDPDRIKRVAAVLEDRDQQLIEFLLDRCCPIQGS